MVAPSHNISSLSASLKCPPGPFSGLCSVNVATMLTATPSHTENPFLSKARTSHPAVPSHAGRPALCQGHFLAHRWARLPEALMVKTQKPCSTQKSWDFCPKTVGSLLVCI